MDLKIYDIIKGPIVTDKSSKLVSNLNKVVLKVHPMANKPMIKEALEKLFNVKVKNVRVILRKGKTRTFKKIKTTDSSEKRAIITLKPGYSLNMGGAAGAPPIEIPGRSKAKE